MGTEERKIFIAFGIVAGFIGLVILFFFINILKQQRRYRILQKEKLNSEINAAQIERNILATELHNDIGPYLSSVKMRLDLINIENKEEYYYEIEACKKALDTCIQQIRGMAKFMSPLSIFKISFQEALNKYVNEVNIQERLKIELTQLDTIQLSAEQNDQLYRILQEIIQNAIKHAAASLLQIEISIENPNTLLIRTSDNGIGYDFDTLHNQNKLGLGLLGIQSRIEYLNGTINKSDESNIGTKYNIRIPLLT